MADGNGEMRTDGEVLTNPGVMIRLAGMEFEFCEPGRKHGRHLMRSMLDIFTKYPYLQNTDALAEIDVIKNPEVGAQMLASVDDLVEVIYAAIPAAGKARRHIDDGAGMEEIVEAFGAVSEVIMRPFVSAEEPTEPQPGQMTD